MIQVRTRMRRFHRKPQTRCFVLARLKGSNLGTEKRWWEGGLGGTAGGPPEAAATIPAVLRDFFKEGGPSNTPSMKTICGGEDWLTLNLYLIHHDFDSLAKRLDQAREAAQFEGDDEIISFGDIRFQADSNGARQGDKQKGSWMRWRLVGENAFTLLLMNAERSNGIQPNGSIRVPSLPLMQRSIDEIYGEIEYIIDRMGSELEAAKVSRVDPCVDLPDVDIEEFCRPFRNGWIVTKARKRSGYGKGIQLSDFYLGSQPTGFTVGNSGLLLRVYEKLIESQRSVEKLALLRANRWGYIPEKAVRVEFQLGRQTLKRYGVDTFDDWLEKRAAICSELTNKWTRLTAASVDRKHADRCELHPIWLKTIAAFEEWTGTPSEDVDLTPLAKLNVDNSKVVKQAVGLLVGVMARSGKQLQDNEMFIRESIFEIQQAIADRNIPSEVKKKGIKLGLS